MKKRTQVRLHSDASYHYLSIDGDWLHRYKRSIWTIKDIRQHIIAVVKTEVKKPYDFTDNLEGD